MDVELRSKVDLLLENYKEITKIFKWDGKKLNIFEVIVYSNADKDMNVKAVKDIRKFAKKLDIPRSVFTKRFIKIVSLICNDDCEYQNVFDETKNVYDYLVSKGFKEVEQTVFAAFVLAHMYKGDHLQDKVKRLITIQRTFNSDAYIGYTLLAITKKEINILKNEYSQIKNLFNQISNLRKEVVESLTFSLMFVEMDVLSKMERLFAIICNIKGASIKIPDLLYPLLGVATMVVEDSEVFVKELQEVYHELENRKALKYFLGYENKIIFSVGILLSKYEEELKAGLMNINNKENALFILEEYTVFSLCS